MIYLYSWNRNCILLLIKNEYECFLVEFCSHYLIPGGKAHYNLPPVTGGYPVGTKVSITCNHGYVQSGVTNITCQISGAWTQSNIKCVASK